MNDTNLPDCQENHELSEINAHSLLVCDLHARGNEVYLPQTAPVDFSSEEYEKEFLRPLPEDIASEVASILKSKRGHFSFLKLVFIFFFLVLAAWAIFHYFPRQIIVSVNDISREGQEISTGYRKIAAKAQEEMDRKQWRAAIELLEEPAGEISQDKTLTQENGVLLGMYFDAVKNSSGYPSETPKAIIRKVREHSPDYMGWYLDELWLNYPECLPADFSKKTIIPGELKAARIKRCLESFKSNWENAPDYNLKNRELLDLFWARLNFYYWLYCDPKKNLDEDDPGVFERERAYQISKKYTESEELVLDFLQLRIDIINAIINAGMGWGDWEGSAYFDGELYWMESTLRKQLDSLESRMEKEKKKLEERK